MLFVSIPCKARLLSVNVERQNIEQELVMLGQKSGRTIQARKRKMMLEHLHQTVMKERSSIRTQLKKIAEQQ